MFFFNQEFSWGEAAKILPKINREGHEKWGFRKNIFQYSKMAFLPDMQMVEEVNGCYPEPGGKVVERRRDFKNVRNVRWEGMRWTKWNPSNMNSFSILALLILACDFIQFCSINSLNSKDAII